MRRDPDVFIMGEDIAEMGGSMGVTQGMLQEFGAERVRNTPISEMAIVGAGHRRGHAGHAPDRRDHVPGLHDARDGADREPGRQAPVHVRRPAEVPLTIRTQGGAGWSPGAQHAQQLEAWFVHVPGLKVAFPSTPVDARNLLWSSIYDDNPVLFFEHRLLYPVKGEVPEETEPLEFGKARVHREGDDVTVVATGRLVHEALKAAAELEDDGISVEVWDPAHAAAARRGRARRVGREDAPLRRRARGRDAHGLGRRGRGDRAGAGVRRARRADRAGRVEVLPASVRARHGAVRHPARGGRPRRYPQRPSEGRT